MTPDKTSSVGRQLDVLWTSGSLTGMSDAQLLGRFAECVIRLRNPHFAS